MRPYVVLFDGHCAFCRAQGKRLARFSTPGCPIVMRDFQDPAVLAEYPPLTHAECMARMHLVAPNGRIYANAEALARILLTRLWAAPFALFYFLPGIRQLADWAYAAVAKRRYQLAKQRRTVICDGDTCSLHFE